MKFDILSSEVRFLHLNVRTETHGDDDRTAIDLKLQWTASARELAQFHPQLCAALYVPPQEQQVPGAEVAPTVRVFNELAPLRWQGEVPRAELTIHHGLGGAEDLRVRECAADSFAIEALDGGTVQVTFRVRAVCEDEAVLGRLPLLLHRSLPMTLRTLAGKPKGLRKKAANDETAPPLLQ